MNKNVLKENRNHGDLMFPLNVYIDNPINKEKHLELHWHGEMEFLVVREGRALFQIEDHFYELNAGDAMFVNSQELHAGFQIEQETCLFDAIVFNPTLLYSYNIDLIQEKYIFPLANKEWSLKSIFKSDLEFDRFVVSQINKMIHCFKQQSDAFELIAKSILYQVFTEAIVNHEMIKGEMKNLKNNYKLERLKNILDYIYNNFQKNMSLSELSSYFSMSEGHFCRFFKEMTRKTPVEFINQYRINEAAKILTSTDEKISQVALEVGFDNIGYFISTFKKQMKCTPSEYRKINAKVS